MELIFHLTFVFSWYVIFCNNSPLAETSQEKVFSIGMDQEILATKSRIAHIRERSLNDIEKAHMVYTQALINYFIFHTAVGDTIFGAKNHIFALVLIYNYYSDKTFCG